MANKTIISDFSSLKGKISFSEKPAAVPEQKKPEQKHSCEERVIRVGQNVVLMDSDLRGRIISLGKTVGIELEDGLTIQAAYGEFAVTHEDEISALKQTKVKSKSTTPLSIKNSGKSATDLLSVDLHIEAIPGAKHIPKGQRLEYQLNVFKRVIHENLSHKGTKINFIHGVGDGILKAAIRKELDEVLALRCSYSVGDPAVTVVTIR